MTLTLSQEQPFPVGDYIVTYVVHDQVTGQSFQLDRRITIDDNAITGAVPLPDFGNDSSNAVTCTANTTRRTVSGIRTIACSSFRRQKRSTTMEEIANLKE